MSTPDYDDTDDQFGDEDQPHANGPRQLREAKARADAKAAEAEARAVAAERRAVFAEAGLTSLTPAQRTLLDKGYDGPLEADAIKAFAQDAGFLAPPAPPEPDVSAQAQDRIANAAGSGSATPTAEAQIQELEAAAAQGKEALLAKIQEHGVTPVV